MNRRFDYDEARGLVEDEYTEMVGTSLLADELNTEKEMRILNFLSGYKTFIVGVCGLAWGLYTQDPQIVVTSLGLMGLRQALFTLNK